MKERNLFSIVWDFLFKLNIYPPLFIRQIVSICICTIGILIIIFATKKIIYKVGRLEKIYEIVFLLSYIFMVAAFTVFGRMNRYRRDMIVIPFWSIYLFVFRQDIGAIIGLVLNIAMFIPIGLLIRKINPSAKTVILLNFAFLLTILIEIGQLIYQRGTFEMDDILMNILGARIGARKRNNNDTHKRRGYDR